MADPDVRVLLPATLNELIRKLKVGDSHDKSYALYIELKNLVDRGEVIQTGNVYRLVNPLAYMAVYRRERMELPWTRVYLGKDEATARRLAEGWLKHGQVGWLQSATGQDLPAKLNAGTVLPADLGIARAS